MEAKRLRKQGLVFSTVVLLISNIFVKGAGFAYRVALVRLLGAEGIGLVEMVGPLFSFFLVLSGCGIQSACSQIIAREGSRSAALYFKTAQRLLLCSGLLVTAAAYALTPLLLRYCVADPRVAQCFRAVLPAVLVICVSSAWRGAFQGVRRVSPLGLSQNVEQTVRVLLGLWLTTRLLAGGETLETTAAASSVATVGGELAGFLCLIFTMQCLRRDELHLFAPQYLSRAQFYTAARELLSYGAPLTLSRLTTSAIVMAQAFLIPWCLQQSGMDMQAATEAYGRFSGVALTLLHLPGVFTAALSVSVLPAVAEHSGSKKKISSVLLRRQVKGSVIATVCFTLPGMILLYVFAEPLCAGLFHNAPAAAILRALAPGGVFFYLQITLSSVLQGLGEVRLLLRNGILSGLVLLVGIYLLTQLPQLGIIGAALAVDAAWLCGFLLNLLACRAKL